MALFAAVAGVPALARPVADRRLRLLREVAQLVIPKTDTPGAGEVGVAAFVVLAMEHGLEGAGPADAAWLAAELDRRAGGDFLSRALARRHAALAALDAEAFAGKAELAAWHRIKNLILLGYYTSEVGGSKELAYEHVPGRFDPDLPVTPATRAYSSDWTAVDFG